MTRTIELTPEQEARLQEEARAQGLAEEEVLRLLIEASLASKPRYLTAGELLHLTKEERERYLRAAAEEAAPLYAADLASDGWKIAPVL